MGAHAKEKKVEVRVIAASNTDFSKKIGEGGFRQDLHFRLARYTVVAPPLRDRPEDIPLLALHFLRLFASEMGKVNADIAIDAMAALVSYPFPGNVRELKNTIERALLESDDSKIRLAHLQFPVSSTPAAVREVRVAAGESTEVPLNLDEAEKFLIKRALQMAQGNVSKTAELLGINRTRIYRVMAQGDDGH